MLGVARFLRRIVLSLAGAVVPLFFLSGSYSPFSSVLPVTSFFRNLLGEQGALVQAFGIGSSPALPLGVAGLTGLATYCVVQRMLGAAQRAAYSQPNVNLNMSEMMRSIQNVVPGMGMQTGVPMDLPGDTFEAAVLDTSKVP